jgi:O-antigen ligase
MSLDLNTPVQKLLEGARLAVMAAAVLGVLLLQDPASADALAPKALWFAVAGGLLPALAAMRLWWGAPLRFPPRRQLLALAVFCGAAGLAYFCSPLKPASQDAWQAWLLSAVLFVAAVDLFAEESARTWLLRVLVVGAGLAGARSLAQRLGLDTSMVGAQEEAAFGRRVAGCFGNPNFAGGFFVLVLPVLLHQAFAGEGKAWKWTARAAAGLAFVGLALTASKAAAVGLLIGVAVAGHLFFRCEAPLGERWKALRWIGAGLGLAVALSLLTLPVDSLKRIAGGPSAWAESVHFRAVTWRGTWNLGLARPVVGWGPGTFASAYPAYRLPEAMDGAAEHAYEVTAPENWVLQIFAETGVVGLAATLALLGLLLWPAFKAARRWREDPAGAGLCLAILCSVAACLGCNLASLDLFLPSTLLPLLLLLAAATALTVEKAPVFSLNPENYVRLLVSAGLALMASVPIVQAQLHAQAARLLAEAKNLSKSGHFDEAAPKYGLAVQFDSSLLEARYFQACNDLDAGGNTRLAQAESEFSELRTYAPDYVQVHAKLGRLYAAENRVPEAAQEFEGQLKLDPWDLDTTRELASLYAANGRLVEAETVLKDAAQRWPADADISRNLAQVELARLGKKRRK